MNSFVLYRVISAAAQGLPQRIAYALSAACADCAYRFNHAARRTLMDNLRVVVDSGRTSFGEAELPRLAQRTFRNFARYVVDFFRIGSLSNPELHALLRVEHVEHLAACRSHGHGIIGLTAHVGSWELAAAALTAAGCRVNAVVLEQPTARLDALFQAQRARRGIHVLPSHDGARAVLDCLGRKELVAMLGDIDFGPSSRHTPFFGRPARLPRGPAVLAARADVPVLPGFVLRQPDDRFICRFHPPILPESPPDPDAIQAAIGAVLETVIAAHPDQWYAFRPVWQPTTG